MKTCLWIFCALLLAVGAMLFVWSRACGSQPPVRASEATAVGAQTNAEPQQVVSLTKAGPQRRIPVQHGFDFYPSATNRLATLSEQEQSEERMMDEVMDGLLDFLSAAIKEKNYKRIAELLAKIKVLNYGIVVGRSTGGAGRAVSVKRQLLQELGGLPPLEAAQLVDQVADLMGDSDLMTAFSARNLVFDTLKEPTLNDGVRANIVTAAMTELKDTESIARLYQEFIRMRHSVGVEAFVEIDASGTDEAKAQLARSMGGFTSDPGITTVSQLKEWFADNPDNPDYDDIYYGHKDAAQDAAQTK